MQFTFFLDNWLPLLVFFVPFWLGSYVYAIRFMLRALAPVARTKFNFYITDFWMASLCLAPVWSIMGPVVEGDYPGRARDLSALTIIALSMILGIVLARIFSLPPDGERMPRSFEQALWVVAGAYFFGVGGLAILFVTYGIVAALLTSCPAVLLPILLIAAIAWRMSRYY